MWKRWGGEGWQWKTKEEQAVELRKERYYFLDNIEIIYDEGTPRKTWWKKRKKTNMSINISRTRWLLAGSSKKIFFDVCHFSFFLPFFPFSFFVPLWWGWSSSCKNLVNAVKMVNCLYNILSHLVAKVKSQFLFLLRYSVNMCRNFRYKIEMAIKLC